MADRQVIPVLYIEYHGDDDDKSPCVASRVTGKNKSKAGKRTPPLFVFIDGQRTSPSLYERDKGSDTPCACCMKGYKYFMSANFFVVIDGKEVTLVRRVDNVEKVVDMPFDCCIQGPECDGKHYIFLADKASDLGLYACVEMHKK